AAASNAVDSAGGSDDGGPRRQPELSETVSWEPETKPPTNDMAILDEEDGITPLPSKFDPRLQRLARQAALDPDDGIAL
ncbi:MAG: conjugal transfer protein TraG, partial [Xanthomonadales bacterium]|nr:conjugal transfer protein TraG [Xanthomonadales bacterium]